MYGLVKENPAAMYETAVFMYELWVLVWFGVASRLGFALQKVCQSGRGGVLRAEMYEKF